MEKLILKHLPREREKVLTARGVPQADFIHGKEQYDVVPNLVKYEVELARMPTRAVGTAKQLKALESICTNPLRSSYVLGISSFPSDALAKALAIHIFNQSMISWQRRHRPGRVLPIWHRVFGGFNDNLRDKPIEETPSLLVLSNINEASSSYKLEKVRDILEKYSHIPRIVVLSGADPLTFFANKLYCPINAGILIGPTNRVKEMG
jgi:hypothetical protein